MGVYLKRAPKCRSPECASGSARSPRLVTGPGDAWRASEELLTP